MVLKKGAMVSSIRHDNVFTYRFFRISFFIALIFAGIPDAGAQETKKLSLAGKNLKLTWGRENGGWRIETLALNKGGSWIHIENPSGENTLLYADQKPDSISSTTFKMITGINFPDPDYRFKAKKWNENTNEVALNTAGQSLHFFPAEGSQVSNDKVRFKHETAAGVVVTEWALDPVFQNDIVVKQTLSVKRPGYFSLASPTLATVEEKNLTWATVPGYFQGNKVQKNVPLSYAYGHGVPDLPVIFRERTASTLCPMISADNGVTFSVIPDPALGRDPWAKDQISHTDWSVGLSHKNRRSQLSPTVYFPILGEPKSELKSGDEISYEFRYSLTEGDWFRSLNHAVYDIYKFKESLNLRENRESLTRRMEKLHHYLTDPETSKWSVKEFEGLSIGAQAYLGGVAGSQKDAMKNSDYGAMWMLARNTNDPLLTKGRLPYALNFKLAQQQTSDGFFNGAAIGQYYLYKSQKFVEEWGTIVEPIGLTYYTIIDMGNILLFEPGNAEIRKRLHTGAETLLNWQKADGSWAVAYDRHTGKEVFNDVKDLRPTFYGLLVAYQSLKDKKYLDAAKKGADWFIANAVNTGSFLGVCGDARFPPDFATGQAAQALLDLYDITGDEKYKNAAVKTARIYTTSVYTHPIATRQIKTVGSRQREDWEISQAGLSFEHGGIFGSANRTGPILLASHAGLFIRMFELTGDRIFLDMARAGAIGRDAFVEQKTSVASYYWNTMDKGAGPYPHHAWWQIGWITDYLMSEAKMRSNGKVSFPKGYFTPKVGPHQTYGFTAGTIFGEQADLQSAEGFLSCDDPQVEYIVAKSAGKNKAFVIFLNTEAEAVTTGIKWGEKAGAFKKITVKDHNGNIISTNKFGQDTRLSLDTYGLTVMVLE